MTPALARHLKDFGTPATPRRGTHAAAATGKTPPHQGAGNGEIDLDTLRAAARQEGYDAAVADLQAEHERTLEEARTANDAACGELRRLLEVEAAETIASRFASLLSDLGSQIGDEAARVLEPFVTSEVETRLAERFAEELRAVLASEDMLAVTLSGPTGLFEHVRDHPAMTGIALTHAESDGVDLKAEIGARILATRLSAFAETLAEVLP